MNPRILVIRGGAIGDFILTLPAIKLLRENFPNAHLEILGYQHIVSLAEGRFYANKTRSLENAGLAAFFVPNATLDRELVEYFGSFNQILSYLYDPDRFFEANIRRCGVRNYIAGSPKIDDSAHAAQQLARPLERLALYLESSGATLHPTGADRDFAAQFLAGLSAPVVALHPGSGSEKKNWPLENWMALGEWMLRDFRSFVCAQDKLSISGFSIGSDRGTETRSENQESKTENSATPSLLVLGGEADQTSVATLKRAWRDRPVRFAEHLPLWQVAAIVERCALFVGHDSGVSHLAAAVGTPCVLMFGPTDPQIWAPANPQVKVVQTPEKTMNALGIDTVKRAIIEAFAACHA
jgi:ADP-heptose:LPS heptosyltransferase